MSAQAVKGVTIEKILSAAGQVVETMNRNIEVMEYEKNALLRIMEQRPELKPKIWPKIDSADREIKRARKRIERYYLIKEHYEHTNIRTLL